MVMLHIKKAIYKKVKTIALEFVEYSGKYEIDMQDYINSKSFYLIKELNDESKFSDFKIDHGVVCWSNGFDIAPEYLFFLANKDNPKYKTLFMEWGYLN
jgi:hypothetical protein